MESLAGIFGILGPIVEGLAVQAPWLITVIFIIGAARIVMKPLMATIEAVIKLTPSQKDDAWYGKLIESKAYKGIAFVLDWFVSLKLPKKEVK